MSDTGRSDATEQAIADEERRAAEEELISQRNAAQREAERESGTGTEQALIMRPEGEAEAVERRE